MIIIWKKKNEHLEVRIFMQQKINNTAVTKTTSATTTVKVTKEIGFQWNEKSVCWQKSLINNK